MVHTYQTIVNKETHDAWNELKSLLGCRSKSEVIEKLLPQTRDALKRRIASSPNSGFEVAIHV